MRLIDGDALCVHIEEEFDGVFVYDVSGNEAAREFCDIVDIAPTIDAIPAEWVEKRLNDMLKGSFSFEECGAIAALLIDWRKWREAKQ